MFFYVGQVIEAPQPYQFFTLNYWADEVSRVQIVDEICRCQHQSHHIEFGQIYLLHMDCQLIIGTLHVSQNHIVGKF